MSEAVCIDINEQKQDASDDAGMKVTDIKFEKKLSLDRSSLGQIIVALNETTKREPQDEFQKELLKDLKVLIPPITEKYNELLRSSQNKWEKSKWKKGEYSHQLDYETRLENLAKGLPGDLRISFRNHKRIKLGTANTGPLVFAASKRILFIKNRHKHLPDFYKKHPEY